jgi:short-subunit dehydrogenase
LTPFALIFRPSPTLIQHEERNNFHEQDQSWRRPRDRGILRHRARNGQSLAERRFSRVRNQPSCSRRTIRRRYHAGLRRDDDAPVAKLVDEVLAKAGRIDLLVNNAGIGLLGGAEESSIAQARALFDVNVFGVLRVTNAVLPTMRRQGMGRIVNLSSVLGLIPAPYSALYSSTKHAIEGYSESLDHELRPFGIRVALVEPAYTRTSFEENLAKPDQLLDIYDSARAGMNGVLRKAIATGDAPEVVARTVLKAATDSVPRRRYAAGKMARQVSFLRRFVPASAFDKSLRKQNGLPV